MNTALLAGGIARVAIEHGLKRMGLDSFSEVAVLSRGGGDCTPLFLALQAELLKKGCWPVLAPDVLGQRLQFFDQARPEQLAHIDPLMSLWYGGRFRARIMILAEEDPLWLSRIQAVDRPRAERIAKAQAAWARTNNPFMDLMLHMDEHGQFGWLLVPWVTPGYAELAGMSMVQYTDFVASAMLLDQPADPLVAWAGLERNNLILQGLLGGVGKIHLVGPDTDLTVSIGGTKWILCSGDRNLPDGEVYTSPTGAVDGTLFCPQTVFNGTLVRNLRLEWQDGRVVGQSADEGFDFVMTTLATDAGARGLGELAFNTNSGITVFTSNILFDEKMGGRTKGQGYCHVALGAAYPETGGTNKSANHWDMVLEVTRAVLDDHVGLVWDGRCWVTE